MGDTQTLGEELAADVHNVEPPQSEKRGFFRRSEKPRSPGRPRASDRIGGKTDKELKDALRKLFKEIAPGITGLVPGADDYDRKIIEVNADRLADAYTDLAKASPPFRRFLEAVLAAGGPFAAAVFATMATVFPILHHHKVISLPPMLGVLMIGEPLEIHDEKAAHGDNGNVAAASGDSPSPADTVGNIP